MSINKIVLASGNAGKLAEFNRLFADSGVSIVPQSDYDLSSVDETGLSFVENAILKARHASHHTGLPALADDSGLEVDALLGQPGIHSARFADGEHLDQDAANNQKLLNSLAGLALEERTARFHCVLVYMRYADDPTPIICQGSWEGLIQHHPEGDNGFGYDPLFHIPELNLTSAQLQSDHKNQISHRGQAMQKLLVQLPKIIAAQ